MLDLRLYRVTLLPFVIALVAVAFSLHPPASALTSPQQGVTFNAAEALHTMRALAAADRDRTPGSADDTALATAIATRAPPRGLAGAHFPALGVVRRTVQTALGARTVDVVVASRAGSGPGIVLIADRNGPSSATALSATAALLELAQVYRTLSTRRPLTLISTAGGASGMAAAIPSIPANTEAAIVIGDVALAGGVPEIVPWSTAGAIAPVALRATLRAALGAALVGNVPDVSLPDQFARLAIPLTTGAQGLLEASGTPAVLVAPGGEVPPGGILATAPSEARMATFGQALLAAEGALDSGPALPTAPVRDLSIGSQILDGGGVRLVTGLLLASLAACVLDVLARARRRRAAVARAYAWVLSFAAPFALAWVFAIFLGLGGLLPARPAAPVTTAQVPVSRAAVAALTSIALLFALAWVLRAVVRHRRRAARQEPVAASAALLATGALLAFLVWLANPYTALLLIVPLHLLLVGLTRQPAWPPLASIAMLVLSLAPVVAVLGLLSVGMGSSPAALPWTLVLLVAGGGLSLGGLLLASVACGCVVAAAVLVLSVVPSQPEPEIRVRGPLRYAGPGSLGGTRSALHR